MSGYQSQAILKNELDKLGLHSVSITTGEADILEQLTQLQYQELRRALTSAGLDLLQNKKDILVQRIMSAILEVVYHMDEPPPYNLSIYLSIRLNHDYTYMSNLFSERQDTTIEKFYICHKIERVKGFLLFEGLTLTEIAYKMHYSSLAHLSSQFKKVTGQTTTQFKKQYTQKPAV